MSQPTITQFFHKRQAVTTGTSGDLPASVCTDDTTASSCGAADSGHSTPAAHSGALTCVLPQEQEAPAQHASASSSPATPTSSSGLLADRTQQIGFENVAEGREPQPLCTLQLAHAQQSVPPISASSPPRSHTGLSHALPHSPVCHPATPLPERHITDVQCMQHLTSECFYDQPLSTSPAQPHLHNQSPPSTDPMLQVPRVAVF